MKAKVLSIVALLLMAVVGATAQTTHTVTVMEGTKDAAKWSADPNPAQQGQTVTVTYAGTKKVKSVKAMMKGAAGKVAAIKLNYTAMTLIPEQQETLRVKTITPDDATDQTVSWSSDKESVATVNATTGEVTAIGAGTAMITATANDGFGTTATCVVSVVVPDLVFTGTRSSAAIPAGQTAVLKDVYISSGQIYCGADATIILIGDNYVEAGDEPAIMPGAGDDYTLTITGTGSLTARSASIAAAIGANYNESVGNITINGGTITAYGGAGGAGIGASDGSITITNTVTKVTATKGFDALHSIGQGYAGGNCGTVTIGGIEGCISESPYTYDPLTGADEVTVIPTANDNAWTLTMPKGNVEMEVVYYTDEEIDQMAADEVIAKITDIGTVTYTAESKSLIDAARTAYDALTKAQKALVTNYDVLTTAENTYAEARSAFIVGVELIDNGDGTWTLAEMPSFDMELKIEYDTNQEWTEEEAAYIAGVELIDNGDGTWTLVEMPDFDIELVVEYDDGTTAVISIKDGKVESVTYYDLNGRKVPKPTKGIYIVNGKKVLIK